MLTLVIGDSQLEVGPSKIDGDESLPEMIHMPLLIAQDSGLAEEKELRTIIHTREDKVFQYESDAHVPESLEKFKKQLIEASKGGKTPLGIRYFEKDLMEVLDDQFGKKILMTPKGEKQNPSDIFKRTEDFVVVIGGFKKGDFISPVYEWAEQEISISDRLMKPCSVAAEVLVSYRYSSLE